MDNSFIGLCCSFRILTGNGLYFTLSSKTTVYTFVHKCRFGIYLCFMSENHHIIKKKKNISSPAHFYGVRISMAVDGELEV